MCVSLTLINTRVLLHGDTFVIFTGTGKQVADNLTSKDYKGYLPHEILHTSLRPAWLSWWGLVSRNGGFLKDEINDKCSIMCSNPIAYIDLFMPALWYWFFARDWKSINRSQVGTHFNSPTLILLCHDSPWFFISYVNSFCLLHAYRGQKGLPRAPFLKLPEYFHGPLNNTFHREQDYKQGQKKKWWG